MTSYARVTGFNGKTAGVYKFSGKEALDENRLVTVQFLTNRNANMPWSFRPEVRSVKVVPGETKHNFSSAMKQNPRWSEKPYLV